MTENLKNDKWTTLTIRIPPELRGYGPAIKRFVDAMIYKLRRNAHKGKWEKLEVTDAVVSLKAEVIELAKAVEDSSTAEILMEGADVANMALIVTEIVLEARGVEAG